MAEDPKILTYKDVVIRNSDLQSIKGQNYINDTVIDFFFAHLFASYQSDEILLISTSISFLLANACDWESFSSTIQPLELEKKKLIFFTVNDSSTLESSYGGTHWSLLVYCRKRNLFMHYDSVDGMNYDSAFSAFECLNSFISHDSADFVECKSPKQRNGYDCALYVMEISNAICQYYFNVDRVRNEDDREICEWFDVMQSVDRDYVEFDMRIELMRLILRLKDEETNS